MTSTETQVAIVGGGPVGLCLAIELGRLGIDCTLIEQTARGAEKHPTANHITGHSMERFRRWGIADRVRHAGLPPGYPDDRIFCTGIGGHELVRFERPANDSPHRPPYSPESDVWCAKPFLDPILEETAASLANVELHHGQHLDSFEQDGDGVTCQVAPTDGGETTTLRAQYLVGCDGGSSGVRKALGIERPGMFGQGPRLHSTYFRAPDLLGMLPRPATQIWVMDPVQGFPAMVAIDGRERWRVHLQGEITDEADAISRIQRMADAEIEVEILSIVPWSLNLGLAERYREGRAFLAGDAAHVVTPYGGIGMNTGIHDAVNLGWKLAAVLQGWGGETLLASYETERRPAALEVLRYQGVDIVDGKAQMTPRRIFAGYDVPADLAAEGPIGERVRAEYSERLREARHDEFANDGISYGQRYDGSPVIILGGDPPLFDFSEYTPSGVPGGRAPHVPLPDGRSTLDLMGDRFTLLRLGNADGSALTNAAETRGLPLTTADAPDAQEAYGADLALVRPDGYIAWRGDSVDAPETILDTITGRA